MEGGGNGPGGNEPDIVPGDLRECTLTPISAMATSDTAVIRERVCGNELGEMNLTPSCTSLLARPMPLQARLAAMGMENAPCPCFP